MWHVDAYYKVYFTCCRCLSLRWRGTVQPRVIGLSSAVNVFDLGLRLGSFLAFFVVVIVLDVGSYDLRCSSSVFVVVIVLDFVLYYLRSTDCLLSFFVRKSWASSSVIGITLYFGRPNYGRGAPLASCLPFQSWFSTVISYVTCRRLRLVSWMPVVVSDSYDRATSGLWRWVWVSESQSDLSSILDFLSIFW